MSLGTWQLKISASLWLSDAVASFGNLGKRTPVLNKQHKYCVVKCDA